ncbi:methyltransferase domain-containing protein [Albidovulum sediminicola]|uniref:Methyltransferase domain-containing protein n=1 Tax=Albidovulum sediminicola TaxID=2984331 RepID=A0ABT2YXR9_9RHOB|nr:methyltransferase domain-containing protein [Defluviimonas sp. WL0075]MCV2863643.1 methyltransferase domain-containing protein [Defluviimonas sp. WL0075]
MDFAGVERQEWRKGAVAAHYASHFARAAEQCVPAFVERVGGPCRALDLCCGHAIVARGLLDRGCQVTAADFSPAMLDLARERVPEANLVEADAMELPFADEEFDAITIGFGIPHVPDPVRVLRECARVLRPDGVLVYSVWHGPERESVLTAVFEAIMQFGDPGIALPPGPGAHDYAQPEIAVPSLAAAGFAAPEFQTVPSIWTLDEPDAPARLFEQGTARGGYLLRQQSDRARRAIRAAVARWVAGHCGEGPPWRVPIPAALVSARRL